MQYSSYNSVPGENAEPMEEKISHILTEGNNEAYQSRYSRHRECGRRYIQSAGDELPQNRAVIPELSIDNYKNTQPEALKKTRHYGSGRSLHTGPGRYFRQSSDRYRRRTHRRYRACVGIHGQSAQKRQACGYGKQSRYRGQRRYASAAGSGKRRYASLRSQRRRRDPYPERAFHRAFIQRFR